MRGSCPAAEAAHNERLVGSPVLMGSGVCHQGAPPPLPLHSQLNIPLITGCTRIAQRRCVSTNQHDDLEVSAVVLQPCSDARHSPCPLAPVSPRTFRKPHCAQRILPDQAAPAVWISEACMIPASAADPAAATAWRDGRSGPGPGRGFHVSGSSYNSAEFPPQPP
jgi:hypothetical protein